ncbi:hypothetical protein DAPPUDRAFT_263092 [Daphnia pulex]|uniref:Uncharacterized protein n=1 Tax=Daphnia pulex TaxID=6669 RepID=E9HP35_DAPPU|nr:hypothetical protein DAPPUDRAFT_263092 [Daphnia pulex]|eukprot:EFX66491.1 hypothetical protein DAPPUDRAFT_263092 [Daphnia pulex]
MFLFLQCSSPATSNVTRTSRQRNRQPKSKSLDVHYSSDQLKNFVSNFKKLFCHLPPIPFVMSVNADSQTAISGQKTLLVAHLDTTIATPSTILIQLVSKMPVLKNFLQSFDMDKADLIPYH